MKVLLMDCHFDGLTLPEGVERTPHQHKWRVNAERTNLDKLGRPYCTECGGMPQFYSLEEVEETSFLCTNSLKQGLAIIVEQDAPKKIVSRGELMLSVLDWVLEEHMAGRRPTSEDVGKQFGMTADEAETLRQELEDMGEFG
jgi:hypothetical protein